MTGNHLSRRTLIALGAGGAFGVALAAGALAPWQPRKAEAQVDPAQSGASVPPEEYDPSLTGTDPALAASETLVTAPATPVVTPESSIPSPTWEPSDAGMSTSLGGSDIAVASEGGSHQVDAPKRKANKILGDNKRP